MKFHIQIKRDERVSAMRLALCALRDFETAAPQNIIIIALRYALCAMRFY